jgi:hypothetical protein
MKLFLDLDGVLADFDRGVKELTGKPPEEQGLRSMWRALARHPDFFNTLSFMADADILWAFCRPHEPTILTGLPLGSWAPAQKARWVSRMLGGDTPLITCLSRDKPRYSKPGHVLVDDRARARAGWEAKGGVFIHHTSAERSIAQLLEAGFEDRRASTPPAGGETALRPESVLRGN